MKHLCTVSDKNFLLQGLALYDSLCETSEDFLLHFFFFDEEPIESIITLPSNTNIVFYNVSDITTDTDEFKQSQLLRSSEYRYYCWSLASYFTKYIMDKIDKPVTYIDSDIYFHKPVDLLYEKFDNNDVGIFRHRQFDLSINYIEGHYNVGVVYFNNSRVGKILLNWWADSVLYKKHPEYATCGDQKYLEVFTQQKTVSVYADHGIGHGAPWQWQLYDYSKYNDGKIIWNGEVQDLVFSHFSQFKYSLPDNQYIASTSHHCYTPIYYYNTWPLTDIYNRYFNRLKKSHETYIREHK
jgi:hypothetical protein